MPISLHKKEECVACTPLRDAKENSTVSVQDRQLAVLYWKLQRQVHTNPGIRTYLHQLTDILKRRHIRPTALNQIGLELVMEEQI